MAIYKQTKLAALRPPNLPTDRFLPPHFFGVVGGGVVAWSGCGVGGESQLVLTLYSRFKGVIIDFKKVSSRSTSVWSKVHWVCAGPISGISQTIAMAA